MSWHSKYSHHDYISIPSSTEHYTRNNLKNTQYLYMLIWHKNMDLAALHWEPWHPMHSRTFLIWPSKLYIRTKFGQGLCQTQFKYYAILLYYWSWHKMQISHEPDGISRLSFYMLIQDVKGHITLYMDHNSWRYTSKSYELAISQKPRLWEIWSLIDCLHTPDQIGV